LKGGLLPRKTRAVKGENIMVRNCARSVAAAAALVLLPLLLPAQAMDEVTLKDGSRIVGEVVGMKDGVLIVKPAFSATQSLEIGWGDVTDLKLSKPLPFQLEDGTQVVGVPEGIREGSIYVKSAELPQATAIPVAQVKSINAKPVAYTGLLAAGLSISDGNTNNKTGSLLGEFIARANRFRLTLRGAYNYAEDDEGLTVRNGKASIKVDYFITKRFYWYANALFEYDAFQDLDLRTALGTGPGYQFIDKGDFEAESLREMQLYVEAGIAYVNENFDDAPDNDYISGRWALRFDWPFLPKRIAFFHFHEGYPSLEDAEDLYITTETGLRFTIWDNFVASAQVNWKWDNTPAAGFERDDTLYLFTIGYSFDAW
jgi:putative salt-induced outer membrane protein YdiY